MSDINTKIYSSRQEKRVADYLGWKVVSGSGARNCFPGDVQADEWLGECKTHTTPGHKLSFSYSVWKKISDEARSRFSSPAYFVDDGSQLLSSTWVMFAERSSLIPVHKCPHDPVTNKTFSIDGLVLRVMYDKFRIAAPSTEGDAPAVIHLQFCGEDVCIAPIETFRRCCVVGE